MGRSWRRPTSKSLGSWAILADLEAGGFLKEIEPLKHEVGTCYRCHSTIEPKMCIRDRKKSVHRFCHPESRGLLKTRYGPAVCCHFGAGAVS